MSPLAFPRFLAKDRALFLSCFRGLKRTTQARSQRQIPRQTCATVQILRLESRGAEKIPRGLGVNQGQVAVQNPPPSTLDGINAPLIEKAGPLLLDEVLAAGIRAQGKDGEHVDALHKLDDQAKVGDMVNFVLKQDPRHLVGYEIGRLVLVAGFEEKVVPQGAA